MALKLRRGTDSGRTAITPAEGEPIYTTDTKQLYIGDGTTAGGVAVGGGVSDGDKGDITVSGSGSTWTIDNDAVTYGKIQNVSTTSRLLGRASAGAGDIEEITIGSGLTLTGTTISASGGGLVNFAETYNLDTARIQPNGAATDIGIVISPKGNGAIQASIRTDGASGGNVRGSNAIDLQMVRGAATQVAAANRSVIISGVNGTVTAGATDAGMYSAGTGSSINAIGTNSVIVGGTSQSVQNTKCAIIGGESNVASGNTSGAFCAVSGTVSAASSVILGALYSGASGYGSTVLGGTSNYAMATYSVTLGGENNNTQKPHTVAMGSGANAQHSAGALVISGQYSTGRAQTQRFVVSNQTASSTAQVIMFNTNGERPQILSNEAHAIKAVVVAKEYNFQTTHYGMWEIEALVTRFTGQSTILQWSNVTTKVTTDAAMVVGLTISGSELHFTFAGRANMQITACVDLTMVNRQ